MQTPARTAEHGKLEMMAGSWAGTERIHPAPWDPSGGTASARVENRLALGGQVLAHDYEQTRDGAAAFTGHGVLRWDEAGGAYVFHWFDSLRTEPAGVCGGLRGGGAGGVARGFGGGRPHAGPPRAAGKRPRGVGLRRGRERLPLPHGRLRR